MQRRYRLKNPGLFLTSGAVYPRSCACVSQARQSGEEHYATVLLPRPWPRGPPVCVGNPIDSLVMNARSDGSIGLAGRHLYGTANESQS
jgi:hypothetical protein